MPIRAGLFQIVTFATHPFRGNPAFVLTRTGNASEATLARMCGQLRTEVIAVIGDPSDAQPTLRFFTDQGPHPGAGHATLAAAHVVLRECADPPREAVAFRLQNGELREARAAASLIAINYPRMPASRVDRADELEAALGARPSEVWVSAFGYVTIFKDAGAIATLRPDMQRVASLDRSAVIATAPYGDGADIVIRVFAPAAGLPEDPVCGTAHRIIVPYWAERLGKPRLHSRHLSPRGGDLWCEARGEEVVIAGESCLAISGIAELPE